MPQFTHLPGHLRADDLRCPNLILSPQGTIHPLRFLVCTLFCLNTSPQTLKVSLLHACWVHVYLCEPTIPDPLKHARVTLFLCVHRAGEYMCY